MKKTTTPASKLGSKLANNKMVQLVARLVKKEDFSVSEEGALELSEDEEHQIAAAYGDSFLSKLKALNFSEASVQEASDLFDEAVRAEAEKMTSEKDTLIEQLRADITRLSEEPEPAPAAQGAGPLAPGVRAAMRQYAINMAASHNALVASALASPNPMDLSRLEGGSLDVSDLNKEFGEVLPPRTRLDLFNKNIYLGIPDAGLFTREQSNTDYKAAASLITEVSQQFTSKWTPKGSVKFTPIVIPYRRHKINLTFKPAEIIKSWLVFLYEQGKTQAEMPVSRYIVEQLVLPKVQDDVTRVMLGKGRYVEVEASEQTEGGAGSAAKDSMDGIETILVDDAAADVKKFNHYRSATNPFALTGQQLLDYVGGFVRAVAKFFVDKPLVYCSEEFLEYYQAQDFAVNGKYTGQTIGNRIRFTGFTFQPMKAMYGSPILFCTPKANMVMLVDYAKASNCINKIEEHHYDVDVMGEYSLSVGFKIGEAVYAAVPGSYDPQDGIIGNSPASDDDDWATGAATSSSSTSGSTEGGSEGSQGGDPDPDPNADDEQGA
ncbi:MAG: hypothetical protein IJV37_05550 [Bacteroidales bacterium]|nr:hypothetical protein [Bacteroidales bacterium]